MEEARGGRILIGDKAPSFQAQTSRGSINFPDDYTGKWVVLFSHPADYTPVCTTEFVAFAITVSSLDTRAGQEAGECVRIVITPRAVGLQERHAAELRRPHDERVLEQSSLSHVSDQCGGWLIHDLGLHRVRLEYVRVRVPVGDAVAA